MDWRWIDSSFAVALDDQPLAIHGGGTGTRHQGLLDSALARPKNLAAYGEPDVAALAASYACGIARTHPVVDGNKRVALLVCETFIVDNGYSLKATDAELAVLFESLAGGEIAEDELAEWFQERVVKP